MSLRSICAVNRLGFKLMGKPIRLVIQLIGTPTWKLVHLGVHSRWLMLSLSKLYRLGILQIRVSPFPSLNIFPQALLLPRLSPQQPQHDKKC